MLKALLFCPVRGNAWMKRYFRDYPIYLLPFANKPAIEFALDYCFLCGIRDVRIVTDDDSLQLRSRYRDGQKCGLNLSYAGTPPGTSLRDVVARNMAFCRGSDLLVFSGLFLPDYDKRATITLEIAPDGVRGCSSGATAWYLVGRDRLADLPRELDSFRDSDPVSGSPVNDVDDYFKLNMQLCGGDVDRYNLPGFSEGKDSFVGRDVTIASSARVKPPVILGNNIVFGRGTFAGPGVVVGDNCLVDDGTVIRHSVVLGNTYIGRNLEIDGKICFGSRIIDPETRVVLDTGNRTIVSEIEHPESRRCPAYQQFIAMLLFFLQSVPYILLRPFLELHDSLAECIISGGRRKSFRLHRYALPAGSPASRLFRMFTLDKYHMLPQAVAGKLRLVGNALLEANERNEAVVRELPGYAPGVFSYSEYLGHGGDGHPQLEFDEQYYDYAMNCWFNIEILTGILLRNLKTTGGALQQRGALE